MPDLKPQRAQDKSTKPLKTLEVAVPSAREFGYDRIIKAGELVRLNPAKDKSVGLAAGKMFNLMLSAAAAGGFEDKLYSIPKVDIRRAHKSNEHIDDILAELQTTLFTTEVVSPRGRRAKLRTVLVSASIEEEDRADDDSLLYFRLPPDLLRVYRESTNWAALHGPTLVKFDSAYALRLYEIGCQMYQRREPTLALTVPELRQLLHVPPSAYSDWAQVRRYVLEGPIKEVNQLADFVVSVPENRIKRRGRKVVSLEISFWPKPDVEAGKAARERQRHSAGRRARRKGAAESVVED